MAGSIEHAHDAQAHDEHAPGERASSGGSVHAHGDHGHSHAHHRVPPPDPSRGFVLGISLNVAFVVAEVIAGFAASSTALLADATHNLGDCLGLGIAWGAVILARRKRTARRTYGLQRSTILAGLANAMLILVAVGGVIWEAVRRIGEPSAVDGGIVVVVASIGILVNGGTALLFARGRERDVNRRGAYLHLMADAAVSAAVVVVGIVVLQTGWYWIDPALSIVVALLIVVTTVGLLREAVDLLLDAVPSHIDPDAVHAYLAGLPGVVGVHDLHIWPISTTDVALTAHLEVRGDGRGPTFVHTAARVIEERFGIAHATIQLEPTEPAIVCMRPNRCI